jgi:hypothetical protein
LRRGGGDEPKDAIGRWPIIEMGRAFGEPIAKPATRSVLFHLNRNAPAGCGLPRQGTLSGSLAVHFHSTTSRSGGSARSLKTVARLRNPHMVHIPSRRPANRLRRRTENTRGSLRQTASGAGVHVAGARQPAGACTFGSGRPPRGWPVGGVFPLRRRRHVSGMVLRSG